MTPFDPTFWLNLLIAAPWCGAALGLAAAWRADARLAWRILSATALVCLLLSGVLLSSEPDREVVATQWGVWFAWPDAPEMAVSWRWSAESARMLMAAFVSAAILWLGRIGQWGTDSAASPTAAQWLLACSVSFWLTDDAWCALCAQGGLLAAAFVLTAWQPAWPQAGAAARRMWATGTVSDAVLAVAVLGVVWLGGTFDLRELAHPTTAFSWAELSPALVGITVVGLWLGTLGRSGHFPVLWVSEVAAQPSGSAAGLIYVVALWPTAWRWWEFGANWFQATAAGQHFVVSWLTAAAVTGAWVALCTDDPRRMLVDLSATVLALAGLARVLAGAGDLETGYWQMIAALSAVVWGLGCLHGLPESPSGTEERSGGWRMHVGPGGFWIAGTVGAAAPDTRAAPVTQTERAAPQAWAWCLGSALAFAAATRLPAATSAAEGGAPAPAATAAGQAAQRAIPMWAPTALVLAQGLAAAAAVRFASRASTWATTSTRSLAPWLVAGGALVWLGGPTCARVLTWTRLGPEAMTAVLRTLAPSLLAVGGGFLLALVFQVCPLTWRRRWLDACRPLWETGQQRFYVSAALLGAVGWPLRAAAQLVRFVDWFAVETIGWGAVRRWPARLADGGDELRNSGAAFYALALSLAAGMVLLTVLLLAR